MERLPEEMILNIFSLLDARSLLACSRVNKLWNQVTNELPLEIWHQVCLDADIFVKEKYKTAEEWKTFLCSMLQRKDDLQTSRCFRSVPYQVLTPLSAIYCSEKKIAMGFISGQIEIRNLPKCEFIREFRCNFKPSFLKFDDNILLAGSTYGIIRSWSMETGRFLRDYSQIGEIPTSCDFLPECDVLAYSFIDISLCFTAIRIYSMSDLQVSTALILREQSFIVRVMLSPHPDYPVSEERKACFLFCLALDYVHGYTVVSGLHTISYQHVISRQFNDIPPELGTVTDIIYKPLGELKFDGSSLHIRTTSIPSATHAIWNWNFRHDVEAGLISDDQITSLLGVGQMYLAYGIKTGGNLERIIISDKVTYEVGAIIHLPRKNKLAVDYLCLVETSWLDGLDGDNDKGIVCAFIAEDKLSINFIEFIPRLQ